MKRDLKELVQELLKHIDNNPLTDEQIEKIEKWVEENKKMISRERKERKDGYVIITRVTST